MTRVITTIIHRDPIITWTWFVNEFFEPCDITRQRSVRSAGLCQRVNLPDGTRECVTNRAVDSESYTRLYGACEVPYVARGNDDVMFPSVMSLSFFSVPFVLSL